MLWAIIIYCDALINSPFRGKIFVNKFKSTAGMLMSLVFVVIIAIACNKSEDPPVPTTTGANNSATLTSNTPATAQKKDIAGNYDVTGTNFDGGGSYKATLVVSPRDDVYQFSWISGTDSTAGENRPKLAVANSYDGVGVMTDNTIAVSYTDGQDGKGCGVVLYKIGADGSLDGKSGYWGVNSDESEKASRKSGTDLDGTYDVTGRNVDGKYYKGTLEVKKDGEGYAFNWDAGGSLNGFGIKQGDKAIVGFGGKQCAFVAYEIKPDGTLEGKWGGQGVKSFGTETATKK